METSFIQTLKDAVTEHDQAGNAETRKAVRGSLREQLTGTGISLAALPEAPDQIDYTAYVTHVGFNLRRGNVASMELHIDLPFLMGRQVRHLEFYLKDSNPILTLSLADPLTMNVKALPVVAEWYDR